MTSRSKTAKLRRRDERRREIAAVVCKDFEELTAEEISKVVQYANQNAPLKIGYTLCEARANAVRCLANAREEAEHSPGHPGNVSSEGVRRAKETIERANRQAYDAVRAFIKPGPWASREESMKLANKVARKHVLES